MRTTGLAFALCLLPSIGVAHHSFQVFYDPGQTIEIEGEITRVAWVNPHVELTLRDVDGELWDLETNSVSILRRMDITADFVSIGDLANPRWCLHSGRKHIPGMEHESHGQKEFSVSSAW